MSDQEPHDPVESPTASEPAVKKPNRAGAWIGAGIVAAVLVIGAAAANGGQSAQNGPEANAVSGRTDTACAPVSLSSPPLEYLTTDAGPDHSPARQWFAVAAGPSGLGLSGAVGADGQPTPLNPVFWVASMDEQDFLTPLALNADAEGVANARLDPRLIPSQSEMTQLATAVAALQTCS